MDHDMVEASNLHRQILHSTAGVGTAKVESAVVALRRYVRPLARTSPPLTTPPFPPPARLNPHPTYVPHAFALSPSNAADVLQHYDLVLDCTDHPSLRYLISDTAVLAGIPIVSASALRCDGQLIVLNSPPGEGPCYRCIWPRPPPTPTSCADGGILGPVVGTMGVLQALEAIKLLVRGAGPVTMTLFSAWPQLAFRHCRMRPRRKGCPGCNGTAPATDYVALCAPPAAVLTPEERVAAPEYRELRERGDDHALLDVRDPTQYALCHLPGSWSECPVCVCVCGCVLTGVDVPFEEFERAPTLPGRVRDRLHGARAVYVMCRLGNDSQVVARMLKAAGVAEGRVWDVKGGIREWARTAPEGFPEY